MSSSSSMAMAMASSKTPLFITAESVRSTLTHLRLIDHLQSSLPSASLSHSAPPRQTHAVSAASSLLLMPSWSLSPSLPYIGVKLVTHFPSNSAACLPGVQATYSLFSSATGSPLATIDATELTLLRTSAVSGLASRLLSREDSRIMLMIGAGSLAPHLIRAHLAARPGLTRVVIWNRTPEKAAALAAELARDGSSVLLEWSDCLDDDVVGAADVVSCATNSEVALVEGWRLRPGAHLDLVGSFKETMRECDDAAVGRGRVFVDDVAALEEAGELVGAFERGVIERKDVCGTLVEIVKGERVGRRNSEEITVFKSVGSALVDLLAAQLVYEKFIMHQN